MISSANRKFLYRQGNFFIIYGDYSRKGLTISLGPNRWAFLFVLAVLMCMSLVVSETSKRINQPLLQCLYWMCYLVGIFCYMYTGMANAGVIIRDENNAIENGDDLEKQNYCYCSICQLYRPPKANHCPICGFCFYNHDHHCGVMGQCIARNNLITFYVCLGAFVITYVVSEYLYFNPFVFLRTIIDHLFKCTVFNKHDTELRSPTKEHRPSHLPSASPSPPPQSTAIPSPD